MDQKPAESPSKTIVYCSFCGKSQNQVEKIIAGPTVFICDECVELCADIIREERREDAKSTPPLNQASVEAMFHEFTKAWNEGDLTRACEVYADDVSFVGKDGYLRSKDKIIEHYRAKYPDPAKMGHLTLHLLEFRRAKTLGPSEALIATAILRWELTTGDGQKHSGYTMEIYERRDDKIFIVQDITI